jgi:hypothetical protein
MPVAIASAVGTFVIVLAIQGWLLSLSVQRELERQIPEQSVASGAGLGAVSVQVNPLPPLLYAAVVFVVAFVWITRRRRRREPRVASPE